MWRCLIFFSALTALVIAQERPPAVMDLEAPVTGNVAPHCRLFALGDLHGDLSGARRALEAAKLIDSSGSWIGGCSCLVQTGDIVDRGLEGVKTLYFLKSLHKEARKVGGRVVQLLGNHEIMTFAGNVAYANEKEMKAFGGAEHYKELFKGSNGPIFKWLSTRNMVALINGTVFVHAGITPSFASLGVNRLNFLARTQIAKGDFDSGVFGNDGPVWTRKIISDAANGDCTEIDASLELLGARRMVIGHTVQADRKIVSYCQGSLLAIDIGLSRFMASAAPGLVELLEGLDVQAFYSSREVYQPDDDKDEVPGQDEVKLLQL